MLFQDVVSRGTVPAIEKMLAFTEARHRMIVENIANVDTPHYKTRQLDVQAFQHSLKQALDRQRRTTDAGLSLRPTKQYRRDAADRLVVTPAEEPAENVLFHDRTNARIEKQMAMLAENAMMHQISAELLRGRFEGLLKAIRGRIT